MDMPSTARSDDLGDDNSELALEPGQIVGEYQVEQRLGEGGFGAVYRAVHPVIGKRAAVKVLSLRYSTHPDTISRFIDEARSVNQIQNRHIVDIFSFGQPATPQTRGTGTWGPPMRLWQPSEILRVMLRAPAGMAAPARQAR